MHYLFLKPSDFDLTILFICLVVLVDDQNAGYFDSCVLSIRHWSVISPKLDELVILIEIANLKRLADLNLHLLTQFAIQLEWNISHLSTEIDQPCEIAYLRQLT